MSIIGRKPCWGALGTCKPATRAAAFRTRSSLHDSSFLLYVLAAIQWILLESPASCINLCKARRQQAALCGFLANSLLKGRKQALLPVQRFWVVCRELLYLTLQLVVATLSLYNSVPKDLSSNLLGDITSCKAATRFRTPKSNGFGIPKAH